MEGTTVSDSSLDLPTKRFHQVPFSLNMLNTVEDIECDLTPPYLRDSQTWKGYARARAALDYSNMMKSNMKFIDNQRTKRWHVQDVDLNAWRENKIDKRMIYNSNDNLLKEPTALAAHSRPTTPEHDVPRPNAELKVEKNYILDTKFRIRSPINMTAKRLMAQTMKEFNKPAEPPETPYCSPKHKMSINLEEGRSKPLEYDVVRNFPMGVTRWARRHDGTICNHNSQNSLGQFCDVLGPYVCRKCIEITNRRIIAEIQKETFPELEFSITNLIAPSLANSMMKGDRLMSRDKHRSAKGLSRSVSDASGVKRKALKLPVVYTKANTNVFRRPGIEDKWQQNARAFHSAMDSRTEEDLPYDQTTDITATPRTPKTASGLYMDDQKSKRTVSISPIKKIVY